MTEPPRVVAVTRPPVPSISRPEVAAQHHGVLGAPLTGLAAVGPATLARRGRR